MIHAIGLEEVRQRHERAEYWYHTSKDGEVERPNERQMHADIGWLINAIDQIIRIIETGHD